MYLAILLLLLQVHEPTRMQVDQLQREYILILPQIKSDVPAPVVFAFHGHGGTMRNSAKKFRIHELWPEAIVVYPRGLPTPSMTDPEGKKPGWQKTVDDQQDSFTTLHSEPHSIWSAPIHRSLML